MPDTPDLFADQAKERTDASAPAGRKIVFDDTSGPPPTLPDGRYDGEGDWSRDALISKARRGGLDNDRERALLMLYRHRRIDAGDFAEVHDSFRLAARVEELRHDIEEAPPIETDESGPGRADYYIPDAN